ncbi:uncharacterized protein LOC115910625 [Camarhynchus parvulus]|uniref:uncharacterized protein LOC115910625 n=1 Tax=Geospiza parvula TaxID=87175 RepID=UPI001238172C|nr:uncharacterized protein LOC115910625 [Camarhynchus parvulus]
MARGHRRAPPALPKEEPAPHGPAGQPRFRFRGREAAGAPPSSACPGGGGACPGSGRGLSRGRGCSHGAGRAPPHAGPPGAPRAPPVPPPRPGRKNRRSSEWPVQRKLREFFAVPRCLVSVFSLFLVELIRFLGEAVVQVLVVGVLTAIGDHVLKPFLAALFHSLLQPLLLFLLKVLGGVRDLAEPLLDVVARLCSQLAVLLRAVRLVEIRLRPDLRAGPADGGA